MFTRAPQAGRALLSLAHAGHLRRARGAVSAFAPAPSRPTTAACRCHSTGFCLHPRHGRRTGGTSVMSQAPHRCAGPGCLDPSHRRLHRCAGPGCQDPAHHRRRTFANDIGGRRAFSTDSAAGGKASPPPGEKENEDVAAENEEEVEQQSPEQQKIDALEGEVEKLKETVDSWKQEAARITADAFNHAERLKKDVKKAETFAIRSFAKDLLEVADTLDKALETTKKDEHNAQLFDGITLTQQQLSKVFEKFNVRRVDSTGIFNPNLHEVMFQVPDAEKPAGTIIQVVTEGYKLGEQTLRGAKVGVTSAAS